MANFQTHLTASTILGIGYGGVAYGMYGVHAPSCVLAAGLCSLSGMLPDIDSGPGRPLKEITSFMGAAVPTMLFGRLLGFGLSQETIILAAAGIYAAIRFGLAWFLKHYTVHRGMFHSFPAAAIFGLLTFLLFYGENTTVRWFVAGGVVLGYLSHLLLDELYSVQWDGSARLKKSFGTAMKFFGEGWWPNLSAYAKLAVLAFLVLEEPGLVQQLQAGKADQVVQDLRQDLGVRWPGSPPPAKRPKSAAPADSADPQSPNRQAAETTDGALRR